MWPGFCKGNKSHLNENVLVPVHTHILDVLHIFGTLHIFGSGENMQGVNNEL